jgi:hypothetical protein
MTTDTSVSPGPYFKVKPGKLAEFKALCDQMVQETSEEPGALYCGFCFDGDQAFSREAYQNADAWVAHLGNIGAIFGEMLKVADLARLEVHGPETELVKVRKVLSDMGIPAQCWTLEYGFRKSGVAV